MPYSRMIYSSHTPRKRMGGQTEGNEERETGRKRVGERIKDNCNGNRKGRNN